MLSIYHAGLIYWTLKLLNSMLLSYYTALISWTLKLQNITENYRIVQYAFIRLYNFNLLATKTAENYRIVQYAFIALCSFNFWATKTAQQYSSNTRLWRQCIWLRSGPINNLPILLLC